MAEHEPARTTSSTGPRSKGAARAPIDWPPGLSPSAALARREWGLEVSDEVGVAAERRDSGLVVETWRDAVTVGARHLDVALMYELDTLVGLQVVGLTDDELGALGFSSVDAEDGLVSRRAGVTLWICDLIDRVLRLEPDSDATDAGMV